MSIGGKMTKININKANHEFDVWIEKHVFGHESAPQCPCDPENDIRDIDGWQWECSRCGMTGYINRRGFSTDISHNVPVSPCTIDLASAIDVIEQCREQGIYIHIDCGSTGYWVASYRDCECGGGLTVVDGWDVAYEDVPLAICRAAYAALNQK
jgi:hypothetical protein